MAVVWCGEVNGEVCAVATFETPYGQGHVMTSQDGIISVDWGRDDEEVEPWHTAAKSANPIEPGHEEVARRAGEMAEAGVLQLKEYFAGTRRLFDVPLVFKGTAFQMDVWRYLQTIPYGETRSYGDVARAIGRDKAVRAVGQANRANPIAIMIPCHRVVGSNGALTGYAGSQVHLKAGLLELEGKTAVSVG